MLILEYKAYGKPKQFEAVDEAIRTAQFIRNKALRDWMDNKDVGTYDLSKYCAVLAAEFPFAQKLNSMARRLSRAIKGEKSLRYEYDFGSTTELNIRLVGEHVRGLKPELSIIARNDAPSIDCDQCG